MANDNRTPQESLDDGGTVYRGWASKTMNVTGVLQITAGALSVVFGISAIILKAFMSYLWLPIWGCMLIFTITGSLGVANYYKPKSKKIVKRFLVMSAISAVFALCMIIAYALFISHEYRYWDRFLCQPLRRTSCESPPWSRILINSLLLSVASLELLVAMIACFVASCHSCECGQDLLNFCKRCRPLKICRLCMEDPGNSNVVYYAVNMGDGGMQMMAVPNSQGTGPIYGEGHDGSPGPPPAPLMFVAPSPQHHTFAQMPVVQQEHQTIPRLPPPPKHQRTQQPVLIPQQQPVLIPQPIMDTASGQTGYMQVQVPWQTQQQVQTPAQSTPEQRTSELAGESGSIQAQGSSQMQPQIASVGQSLTQQQESGLPAGQPSFVQIQAPGEMKPQVLAPMQLVPAVNPAAVAPYWGGFPSGQMGFYQVPGPGGQIHMVPRMYPQAATGLQQPDPGQVGPVGPEPTQEQVQLVMAPSSEAEVAPEPTQEQVTQTMVPSSEAEVHFEDEDLDLTEVQASA